MNLLRLGTRESTHPSLREICGDLLGIMLLEGKLDKTGDKYEEIVDRFLDAREAKLLGTLRIVIRDFAAEEKQAEETPTLTTEEKVRAKTVELIDRAVADLNALKNNILQKPEAASGRGRAKGREPKR